MAGGEPADGELAEGVLADAIVGRGDGRGAEGARAVPQLQRRRLHHAHRCAVGQQPGHALHRHVGLAVVGPRARRPPREVREDADGRREETDVTDRGVAASEGGDDEQHDETGADVPDGGRAGAEHLRGDLVDPGGGRPGLAELLEPTGHRGLGAGHLHRADGAEEVADEPGDRGGGLALVPTPRPQSVAQQAAQPEGDHHRDHDHERDAHIDGGHHGHGRRGGHRRAGHVEPHIEDHRQVHRVVSEATDCLAAGAREATDDRPRVVHQRSEQVDAGQRVPEHPAAVPLDDGEPQHRPTPDLDHREGDEQARHRLGGSGGHAVEHDLEDQARGDRHQVEDRPREERDHVRDRLAAREAPRHPGGRGRRRCQPGIELQS